MIQLSIFSQKPDEIENLMQDKSASMVIEGNTDSF